MWQLLLSLNQQLLIISEYKLIVNTDTSIGEILVRINQYLTDSHRYLHDYSLF